MAFTSDEIQFMAAHGWDIQPDGVTFRDRSYRETSWIEHGPFGWQMVTDHIGNDQFGEFDHRVTRSETFDSPIAVVVSMEIDRSNNQ
jgi:hypothetical protein